ncbi:MAG: hypothetical protein Kow0025_04180 [Thermodesulfovibrionales bacterium]
MTGNVPISDSHGGFVTFVSPAGKAFSLKIGSVVTAEVMEVIDSGLVTLRITPPAGRSEGMRGMVIRAHSEVPLAKGQGIVLEYTGGGRDVRMRFIGLERPGGPPPSGDASPQADRAPAAPAPPAHGRLGAAELRAILRMFQSVPGYLKAAYPDLRAMERLMPHVSELGGRGLRRLIEGSGVLLETKLRLAAQEGRAEAAPSRLMESLKDPGTMEALRQALGEEDMSLLLAGRPSAQGRQDGVPIAEDMKAALLRAAGTLRDAAASEALRAAGLKPSEMAEAADKFIRHIEHFQHASRATGDFHAFVPLLWEELKDGEFRFGKRSRQGREACACDITLDLETLGRLSVSVARYEGAFYVSFAAERAEARDLIASERAALMEGLEAQGLAVRAINVSREPASPGAPSQGPPLWGIDLRI